MKEKKKQVKIESVSPLDISINGILDCSPRKVLGIFGEIGRRIFRPDKQTEELKAELAEIKKMLEKVSKSK